MAQKTRVVVFLPIQLAHQFDALAVSLQTTRSALVTEALQTALPQLRASATARFISGEANPGPRKFWPRAGSTGHTLVQLRQIVARYDDRVRNRMDALRDRIDAQGKETTEQLGHLRERMAKLEGLLEGLREAITGKRAA